LTTVLKDVIITQQIHQLIKRKATMTIISEDSKEALVFGRSPIKRPADKEKARTDMKRVKIEKCRKVFFGRKVKVTRN
jgi:hypothetical protein